MENFNLTNNEKILNSAKGIESDNIAKIMSSDNDLNTIIKKEAINKFNQEVENYNAKSRNANIAYAAFLPFTLDNIYVPNIRVTIMNNVIPIPIPASLPF